MARPSKSQPAQAVRTPSTPSAKPVVKRHTDYTSEGVKDHDVFLLPGSDYQIMLVTTIVAAVVRLFRIYQPSSVVFDEVQYVLISNSVEILQLTLAFTASVDLPRNTSRGNFSWMSILH